MKQHFALFLFFSFLFKLFLQSFQRKARKIRILLSCGVMQSRNERFANRTIWLQSQPRLAVEASWGGGGCKFKEMTEVRTLLEVLTFSTFTCLQNT